MVSSNDDFDNGHSEFAHYYCFFFLGVGLDNHELHSIVLWLHCIDLVQILLSCYWPLCCIAFFRLRLVSLGDHYNEVDFSTLCFALQKAILQAHFIFVRTT